MTSTAPPGQGLSAGTGGRLFEQDITPVDDRAGPAAPRDAGTVLLRAVVTIPFDVSVVPPGSFESGSWAVYTAATALAYGSGDREALGTASLLAVDYLRGEITLDLGLPRVIGIDPTAAPPLETEDPAAALPETRGASSGGGGGGCFVRALVR